MGCWPRCNGEALMSTAAVGLARAGDLARARARFIARWRLPCTDTACPASRRVFAHAGWDLTIPTDHQGAILQDTNHLPNGSMQCSVDTLCAIATRRAAGAVPQPPVAATFSRQIKHYPIVQLSHGGRTVAVASVHIHFLSTAPEFEAAVQTLRRQGVSLVGGDFNKDLVAHRSFGALEDPARHGRILLHVLELSAA